MESPNDVPAQNEGETPLSVSLLLDLPMSSLSSTCFLQQQPEDCYVTLQEQQNDFEKKCQYNLDHQYAQWKTNGWGNPPICIPDAMEVNDKWSLRTTDPESADSYKGEHRVKDIKFRADSAERAVHQAFQRSTIGGLIIQGFDLASLWVKLNDRKDGIKSDEVLSQLLRYAAHDSFEIDCLLLHPICGIVVIECKSSPLTLKKYKIAKKQVERTVQKLLEVFQIFTGTECPKDYIHSVLCFPNAEKTCINRDDHVNVLDRKDLEDKKAFEAFWEVRMTRAQNLASCFESAAICHMIAIAYGYRSAKFISLGCNALEIYRMLDSHQSSQHLNRSFEINNFDKDRIPIQGSKNAIFLNSEQIKAYEIAQNGSNMVISGPPGSGKTLLIMILAKEAAEADRAGQVTVCLAYSELVSMYHSFFIANKSQQRRRIVINPSAENLRKSLLDSSDDVFADEVFYGGWIPSIKRQLGQIIVGLTIGRQYNKSSIAFVTDNLKHGLNAEYCFIELKTVMRNTGNIGEYCKKFAQGSEMVIGHNILGRSVVEEETKNIQSACSLIVEEIKRFTVNGTSPYCSWKNIAVLIAHEPVLGQIKYVTRMLEKAGIPAGSVTKQLQMRDATSMSHTPPVAVDCSANALSCEWPIVFVIDASNCPFSRSVANPIVACTRAVSVLFVISTRECDFPSYQQMAYPLSKFCYKVFPEIFFTLQRQQDTFHFKDLVYEFTLSRSRRRLLQILFWYKWLYLFFFFPAMLLSDLFIAYPDDFNLNTTVSYLTLYTFTGIVAILCLFSAIVSLSQSYHQWLTMLMNLVILFSFLTTLSFLCLVILPDFESVVSGLLFGLLAVFVFLIMHICFSLGTIECKNSNYEESYFKESSPIWSTWQIYLSHQMFSIMIITSSLLVAVLFSINIGFGAGAFLGSSLLLVSAPIPFNLSKLSFLPKALKSVNIVPPISYDSQ